MAGSSAGRLVGSLLVLVAAFAVLGFLFLVYAGDDGYGGVSLNEDERQYGLFGCIGLGVVALIALLVMLTRRRTPKQEFAEQAEVFFLPEPAPVAPRTTTEFTTNPEITLYDLSKVPIARRSWSAAEMDGRQVPFYFPRSLAGGIYVNDYVPIDASGKLLKLRTLLGGSYEAAYADTTGPRSRRPRAAVREPADDGFAPPGRAVQATASSGLLLQEVAPESLAAQPVVEEFHFDYPGDNHEVEDLEGIGPTYGQRLRDAGVHTTARLAFEDAGKLAEAIQVPRGTVAAWQQMAELVKVKGIGPQYAEALVRSGITSIADLKRRSPARMAEQVNAYLASLDTNVLGNKITEKRIEGWKDAAKDLKRVKLQVPAQ